MVDAVADTGDHRVMRRTLCFRAVDDNRLLLKEYSVAFRLTPECERGAGELGVAAGTRVRVELLDDESHLLDFWIYRAG